jgi:hypothetical protein
MACACLEEVLLNYMHELSWLSKSSLEKSGDTLHVYRIPANILWLIKRSLDKMRQKI